MKTCKIFKELNKDGRDNPKRNDLTTAEISLDPTTEEELFSEFQNRKITLRDGKVENHITEHLRL